MSITLPFKKGQLQSQEFGFTEFSKSPAGVRAYGAGRGHEGLDFYSIQDPTIYSIADGTVIIDNDSYNGADSGLFTSYGCYVVIKDDNSNRAWYYCHLDSNSVSAGQKVKAGDRIGIMGGSGNASRSQWGRHLHLGRAILDNNNSRINKYDAFYGFIDGTNDLNSAIDKYNNKPTPIQQPKQTSNQDIQTIMYDKEKIKALAILTSYSSLFPMLSENWVKARVEIDGPASGLELVLNDIAKPLKEQKLKLQDLSEAEVQFLGRIKELEKSNAELQQKLANTLAQKLSLENTLKNHQCEPNVQKVASINQPQEVISNPVVSNVTSNTNTPQNKDIKPKQLSTFDRFIKNNISTIGTIFAGVGVYLSQIVDFAIQSPYTVIAVVLVIVLCFVFAYIQERRNYKKSL